MKRFLFSILYLTITLSAIAQKEETDKASGEEADKPSSYFKIGAGIGNQLLSVNNKALNASQINNKLIFTPNIGYYHKSGLGISFVGYLLSDSGSTNFYQSGLTPSYELDGEDFSFGISYTRYFVKNKYGGSNSPIQNDFYVNTLFKKGWIQPGLAIGFSNGIYKEINLVTVTLPVLGTRTFLDTASTKTTAFSLIGSIGHTFEFDNVISGEDLLSFTPALMLNAGSSKLVTTHQNRYSASGFQNPNRRRIRGNNQSDVTKFGLQSVGANLGLVYSVGSFSLEPQLYLDYYLQASDTKKFTQVYNINFAFTF